ncbi:hypothetical protein MNEG_15637, partial [Monoraphidium neglectum]
VHRAQGLHPAAPRGPHRWPRHRRGPPLHHGPRFGRRRSGPGGRRRQEEQGLLLM